MWTYHLDILSTEDRKTHELVMSPIYSESNGLMASVMSLHDRCIIGTVKYYAVLSESLHTQSTWQNVGPEEVLSVGRCIINLTVFAVTIILP